MRPEENEEQILAALRDMLIEAVGDELMLDQPIEMDTSFNEDLELESIEFVALAEQLELRYGESVDFSRWIAEKELDEIIALKVGDLVRYIASCRT